MNSIRWRQLWAVFRLEIGKSFLSRRGLWIYALALLPVLLFAGHALYAQRQHRERADKATPGATRELLRTIHPGMPREEVLRLLPKPNRQFSFRRLMTASRTRWTAYPSARSCRAVCKTQTWVSMPVRMI